MRYALLLKPHANVRYRQSLQKLALVELKCMLKAWGIEDAHARLMDVSGEPFVVFDARELTAAAWHEISGLSAACFAAEETAQGLLRPIARDQRGGILEDLPQVLKYKGKTNADFTSLMLHCAKAASAFAQSGERLCVLDPMCGKATTLFCALDENYDAVGVELDGKAVREADAYLERSLKLHHLKHKRTVGSQTLSGGMSARVTEYVIAPDAKAMREGRAQRLRLFTGDAARLSEMLHPESCHLIVSDLPYGVQHAPREGGEMSSLTRLIERALPGCVRALKRGGAIAFSFNLNTLSRKSVVQAMKEAGLEALEQAPYDDFSHWVEQAVERDVVIARRV